ncbi:hypothetical protein ACFWGT_04085 [Nocardiopsis sp. NPDC060348]|uniref:hypothetical protein n=1 Tax=Nocardiopsis sp. NPDC060348 TaxID=3347102 RepID=UPI0036476FFE
MSAEEVLDPVDRRRPPDPHVQLVEVVQAVIRSRAWSGTATPRASSTPRTASIRPSTRPLASPSRRGRPISSVRNSSSLKDMMSSREPGAVADSAAST